jgi:hypothetical protein
MCPNIRCDGESEKFCKIFGELNGAHALVVVNVNDWFVH